MKNHKLRATRYTALRNMGASTAQAVSGRTEKGFQRIMDELQGKEVTWSQSVTQWRAKTFGLGLTPLAGFERACKEWDELDRALNGLSQATPGDCAEECADVAIVLCGVCEALGFDLADMIARKMVKNRARTWVSNGDGTGQHVKEAK